MQVLPEDLSDAVQASPLTVQLLDVTVREQNPLTPRNMRGSYNSDTKRERLDLCENTSAFTSRT